MNCNLQRLDGPVRGNGKIIQELEAVFRGSGWNVIKVIWARDWDDLLARDVDGVLVNKMNETLDGEYHWWGLSPSPSESTLPTSSTTRAAEGLAPSSRRAQLS